MSDDYYSPHPARIPRLPIALTGDRGGSFDRVTRLVAALSALPLGDLRELVEHDFGGPVQRLRDELGDTALVENLRVALDRALDSEPHGILVVEASFLADRSVVEMLGQRAVLVHLRDQIAAADARAESESDPLEQQRRRDVDAALDTAVLRFELGDAPHQVARSVIRELGLDDPELG